MDENKFTPTAEEALQLAQEAAGELGHGYMGTEHLLLGLMREDEGLAHTVLTEAGLTDDLLTEMIRSAFDSFEGFHSDEAHIGGIPVHIDLINAKLSHRSFVLSLILLRWIPSWKQRKSL